MIELLVVMAIIAIFLGMIAFLPESDKRNAAVKSAAEELAATLRLARSLSIERRAVIGVSFNVQNGAETKGRVLNNWSGGHWYRIIGSSQNESVDVLSSICVGLPTYPQYSPHTVASGNKTSTYLRNVEAAWIGDRHVLPTRKVRFLALGDQDNGGIIANARTFGATYPRPWFGYWDSTTRKLRPWGGYDPAVTDGNGQKSSGFWFQRRGESDLADCRNPSDVTFEGATILKQGEARPVINGAWLDYVLRFNPDGTVSDGMSMQPRKIQYENNNSGGGLALSMESPTGLHADWRLRPDLDLTTNYVGHTGCWSVTLAPDISRDTDEFPTARDAWKTLMPAYRVIVDRYGLVKVVKVRFTEPTGVTYDPTTVNYQNVGSIQTYYRRNVATNANNTLRGTPVTDFLTPELLARRNWWMTP